VSSLERTRRGSGRSARRRRPFLRALVIALFAVLVFFLGVAFARTLDDRPTQGGDQTIVRTLEPATQNAPGPTVTVTVTANP
jgi:hypothetical protein